MNLAVRHIPLPFPNAQCLDVRFLTGRALAKALARDNADFDFRHVEPIAMLRQVVDGKAPGTDHNMHEVITVLAES